MKKQRQSQRGFSLIEIMVTLAVFVIIMAAALMIYDRSNKIFKTSVESAEMQQNTRAAFDRMVSEIRMMGFDYDRDGVPVRSASGLWQPDTAYAEGVIVSPTVANGKSYEVISAGQSHTLEPAWPTTVGDTLTDNSVTWRCLGPAYQQPDEQIEFAGKSAITVRANFDFTTDSANGRGREIDYEPDERQFPLVTTGNEEIVTYALRSVSGSNPDTLAFYADVAKPRAAYPGGTAEAQVRIPNVDLCASGCTSPPYTLMRFTIKDDGQPDAGTPVANNIRSLAFSYYSDVPGTTLLTAADASALAQGAIGGLGQYNPDNIAGTANWDDRTQRARIQSVRMTLVGMGEANDPSYVNPAETSTSPARKRRTYTLESLITPRNIGLSGFAEPDPNQPGPPSITSVCVGSCNITRVSWDPPVGGNVNTYEVRWASSAAGPFVNVGVVVPGDVVSAPVFNLNPGTLYFFKVVAVNENGYAESNNSLSRSPVNTTRPSPVTQLAATEGATAQPNQITLTWTAPTTNDSAMANLSCAGVSSSGTLLDPAEPIRYRIWRGTSENFDPLNGGGEVVLDSTVPIQPTGTPGSVITWIDDANNKPHRAPASCKNYWYRIQVYDTCTLLVASIPAANSPNNVSTGTSTVFPNVVGTVLPAIAGYATAAADSVPSAPGQPTIDYSNGNSECDRPNNVCNVKLLWPAVTTDTSNPTNNITVDQYRILRKRKKAADTQWGDDTILPLLDNASSNPGAQEGINVVYHDNTALDHDPNDRRKWYYQYTVTALQCGQESAPSPTVEFPESCGLAASTVIQSGARDGDGSLAAPWVMNATDSIEVIPPAGVPLDRVQFEIYPEPDLNPNNAPIDRQNQSNPPFVYTWNDQADGAVYRVVITMRNAAGCEEQTERFIQDDPISCPNATASQIGSLSGSGIQSSPWLMGTGDTVTINPPAGGPISSIIFTLTQVSDGAVITTATDVASPFVFTWAAQTDNVDYKLRASVVYSDGCTEDIDRFVRDEPSPVCTGATMAVTGSAGGDGLAQGTAWVLNSPDVLTIAPPVNGNINQVVFTVTAVSPAAAALPAVTDSVTPYTLTWPDRTDNTIYKVDAVIAYAPGCSETVTRYVKDQQCSGATAAQAGSVGAGTGLTSTSPWVFNAADTVTVTPPATLTVVNVVHTLYLGATTTVVATETDAASPYAITWVDRTDNQLYRLESVVTYSAGCTETITRYIQDQSLCFITASTGTITHADDGSRRIATITFTITNPTAELLTVKGVKVDWTRDAAHPSAVLQTIRLNGTVDWPVATQAPPSSGVVAPATPTPGTIPINSSTYTVAMKFDIGKKSEVGDLATNWINGLCIQYTAPSFGSGVTASCNVLGGTSANPTACN
jgi:prepilin-type N-terminal cleavage/methylation domain-containing protein